MSPLFTTPELAQLTQAGGIFKMQTTLNVDTYCYIASHIFEAAMKGETTTTMPVEGRAGIQEIIELIRDTHPNGIYVYWLHEQDAIQVIWRNY